MLNQNVTKSILHNLMHVTYYLRGRGSYCPCAVLLIGAVRKYKKNKQGPKELRFRS